MNHKGTVLLETERLILRRFTEDDAPQVYRNWASDDEVTKYLTWPTHRSAADSLGFMKYCVQSYAEPTCYQWGMELKDTHELIGSLSGVHIDENADSVELGWCIGRRFWGKGYTPEAARAVTAFLFDEVGVNRIAALHDVHNLKSGRVMQKIGMKYEGTLRQYSRNNQGIADCCVYSLLRSER